MRRLRCWIPLLKFTSSLPAFPVTVDHPQLDSPVILRHNLFASWGISQASTRTCRFSREVGTEWDPSWSLRGSECNCRPKGQFRVSRGTPVAMCTTLQEHFQDTQPITTVDGGDAHKSSCSVICFEHRYSGCSCFRVSNERRDRGGHEPALGASETGPGATDEEASGLIVLTQSLVLGDVAKPTTVAS